MTNIFFQIFKALDKNEVQYVLIGGLALILHGIPRSTFDSDIVILGNKKNISNVLKAIKDLNYIPMQADMVTHEAFGKLEEEQCATFSSVKGDIHLDIFLKKNNKFKEMQKRSETRIIYETPVHIAKLDLLLELKKSTGRDIDKTDIILIQKRLSLS